MRAHTYVQLPIPVATLPVPGNTIIRRPATVSLIITRPDGTRMAPPIRLSDSIHGHNYTSALGLGDRIQPLSFS
jgi:hypothetical protein